MACNEGAPEKLEPMEGTLGNQRDPMGGEASKKKVNNKLNASIKVLVAQIVINIIITLWIVFFHDSNFSNQLYGKFILGYQAYNYFYYLMEHLISIYLH